MKGLEIRQRLFVKFSHQLLLLKENEIIDIEFTNERPYLCPICLREFADIDLTQRPKNNFLTLEDAPPYALGGKKVALTCKECNSGCGTTIDFHLKEILRAIDDSYFYKGTKHFRTIDHEGGKVSVELTSEGDGTLRAYHRKSKNNPTLLDKFKFALSNKTLGPLLNLNPPKYNYESKRVNYALLKAAYILMFAKFGYIFLLDKSYDAIRQQLLEPKKEIFPYTPFIKDQFSKEHLGMYYVLNPTIKSILTVFNLKTEYSETVIASLIPVPGLPMGMFAHNVNELRNASGHVDIHNSQYDPDADLFNDLNEIQKILKWIG
ncbi:MULTISPECIES: HNH endonuclease [unclassified Pedobacter]|uniref:HNH endonuclease n=1 Tax=unclassified Pedobacter TaxID=2628915 RepID=UPI001DB9719C|nr:MULTISPECIES: HNH endonuclease [unclassified Pedobacter]CAH0265520.1 hypothetical protein SRABI36_03586 [Pedobacter sp. Bi36]CAH0291933.1 hypothetical protein SRABI126_04080 [Pedobacter sp. Bi126]